MRVAPGALGELGRVALGEVHSACESQASVTHDDLSVRAKVRAREPHSKQVDRVEPRDLDARLVQRLEPLVADVNRPGPVDHEPHFDAGLGLLDEQRAQPLADAIGLEDVVLDVNVVLRR
jgi:hypothetical protein